MIIRATLKTNLYTQIIERYFDDGGPFVLEYFNSKMKYEEFKKCIKKLNKFQLCSKEKEIFKINMEETIKENFFNYIDKINENSNWKTERFEPKDIIKYKRFICRNFEVKIVNVITDTYRNNEVVFYIDFIKQYITL